MHKKTIRELICSMLIGDGNIWKYRFRFCHSEKQYDYLKWKINLINEIFEQKNLPHRMKTLGIKKNGKNYLRCDAYLDWSYITKFLGKRCYKYNKKDFTYILSQIHSPLHLAIWFGDDGWEHRPKYKHLDGKAYYSTPTLLLALGNCTEGEANLCIKWFEHKFKVSPVKFLNNKKNCWSLRFSSKDSKKLFLVISPILKEITSMKNKFWLSYLKIQCEEQDTSYDKEDDTVQKTSSTKKKRGRPPGNNLVSA